MGPAGAVVIDPAAGQMAGDSLCARGRGGRRARHKDVLQVRLSNDGGGACEGAGR
jgi:hypothetical protein